MDEERYRWLLCHIETCPTCDVYREDSSASECPALAAFWRPDPEPQAVATGTP